MGTIASQITGVSSVYSTVCLGADQRENQSSALLAFVWGIHRWPVDSPHKGQVTRKFPFGDVNMWDRLHRRNREILQFPLWWRKTATQLFSHVYMSYICIYVQWILEYQITIEVMFICRHNIVVPLLPKLFESRSPGIISSKKASILTHWGWDNMAAISQSAHSNAFPWMKIYEFRLKFHWSLFLRIQLTIFQHWFR